MKTLCYGVIWVCLCVMGSATMLSAQPINDINAYTNVSRNDLARNLSPAWVPAYGEKGHYFPDMVGTFGTCLFTFYYKPSTNQYVPVSVGLAAKHYSSCSGLTGNVMTIRTDQMYGPPEFRYYIRGAANDFGLFTATITYEWIAESTCNVVNPLSPSNADIRVLYERFDGCRPF